MNKNPALPSMAKYAVDFLDSGYVYLKTKVELAIFQHTEGMKPAEFAVGSVSLDL